MSLSVTCPANIKKGPFPVARNSMVSLSVTAGGSGLVQYVAQPQTQQSVWVDWPNGTVTTTDPEIDVAENNYLAMVSCTAGTATLTISDPDPLNTLPYNNWKSQSQVPLISTAATFLSNNGSSLIWNTTAAQGGGTMPSFGTSDAFKVLTVSTTNPATIGFDWPTGYVVPLTHDTAGLQNAINYALANGCPTVLLEPGATYTITSMVSAFMSNGANASTLSMVCPGGQCTFDGSSLGATSMIYWRGGGGDYHNDLIEGIAFTGQETSTRLLHVNCNIGLTVKRCDFQNASTGIWWHNDILNQYVEMSRAVDCTCNNSVNTFMRYTKGVGTASFHGTGCINCLVKSDGRGPMVQIDSTGNPVAYGAPLEIHAFSIVGAIGHGIVVVQNNSNLAQRFNGWIDVESTNNTTAVVRVGGGTASYIDTVTSLNEFFRLGSMRIAAAGLTNTNVGTIVSLDQTYHSVVACTAGVDLTNALVDVQSGARALARIVGSNYDCSYDLTARRIPGADGTVTINSILREVNTAGYGTVSTGDITFNVDTGGTMFVSNPNWPSTGVVCNFDAIVSGQNEVVARLNSFNVTTRAAIALNNTTVVATGDVTPWVWTADFVSVQDNVSTSNYSVLTTSVAAGSTTIGLGSNIAQSSTVFAIRFSS